MMNQVCKIHPENDGVCYTLMLMSHIKGDYGAFRGYGISMGKDLYGLNQAEAEELTDALIRGFENHNLAEDENTPESEREQHWENARKSLVDYYEVLARAFERYGIHINPEELANNDIKWWQSHNIKDYKKTSEGLAERYKLIYKLSPKATERIALAEIKFTESYDKAKKVEDKQLWIETKILAITCFGVLKEELMNKYPED
jgi:hypothetical protein